MNNVLSQDEVDALLKGVQSGSVETEGGSTAAGGIRNYDFGSQEKIVRGRLPGLDVINERFTRYFRNTVSNLVMRFVDMTVQGTETVKFGDFMKAIPVPSSINIIEMEPLKGYALLVLEAPLVFALLEILFGGGSHMFVKSEGRSFTAIEQRVIKNFVTAALKDCETAWSAVMTAKPRHVSSEMNPQFVTIAMPSEMVVRTEIRLEMKGFTGKLFFCFPYSTLEPVRDRLSSGVQGDRFDANNPAAMRLREMLANAAVRVTAEVGRIQMSFGELMSLKKGDVVTLGTSSTDELVVNVERIPKFRGTPGFSRGNQALKITRTY